MTFFLKLCTYYTEMAKILNKDVNLAIVANLRLKNLKQINYFDS